ncbi:MAG: mycofactocin-associated electron transfer flavoprotein beta subunit [Acidimicrobiales bacterium]
MIAVCLKWVERRPHVDPLTGETATDPRTSGASPADLSALEHGLRLAEAWEDDLVAVTAGEPSAEPMLREALAVGAHRAVRVDAPEGSSSEDVAASLAPVLRGAGTVLCGDWSLDRGSGAVPALLAAHLGAAQALGLVNVVAEGPDHVLASRRLDGGRRERLRVPAPRVLSVEGGLALRRAPLEAVLASKEAPVEIVHSNLHRSAPTADVAPYRPRARELPVPSPDLSARERILALTGALVARTHPELVTLEPADAADRLLGQLRVWGYLEEP